MKPAAFARATLLGGAAAFALLGGAAAWGDDLRGALVSAYNTNPTLQSARATQRANDENVPIARSSGLPSIAATGTHTEILEGSSSSTGGGGVVVAGPERQFSGNVTLNVPIYSGGSVRNSVRAAKVRVEAGQAELRGTESQVFSQAVAA